MSINLALREYTTLPTPEPLPSTGSFNFRQGVYNQRPMTVQEQIFEQFVDVRQAEYDICSFINEWERLKALEEEAIQLWQELDGNLVEYQRQMRTRDQQAMEHQCQRKKEKARHLDQQPVSLRLYEQQCLAMARRRAFQEDVERRAMEVAAQQAPAQQAFMETVNHKLAKLKTLETKKAAAATNAQQTSSEVRSTTDGIRSDPNADLESGGKSSHSQSPQHSGSADSVSRDPGSPSLPTMQPIDNTVPPPPNSPHQPPTLPQSRQNSSNSPSPPRSTSVDDSTPPSSQQPSRSESLRSSPPETVSRFVPDPAIWGRRNLPSSRNQPSQPLISERVARILSMRRRLSFMRSQRSQPVPTSSINMLMLGEQNEHGVPTHGPIRTVERQERPVEEMKEKKARGSEDTFVEIIMKGPPGGGVRRWGW